MEVENAAGKVTVTITGPLENGQNRKHTYNVRQNDPTTTFPKRKPPSDLSEELMAEARRSAAVRAYDSLPDTGSMKYDGVQFYRRADRGGETPERDALIAKVARQIKRNRKADQTKAGKEATAERGDALRERRQRSVEYDPSEVETGWNPTGRSTKLHFVLETMFDNWESACKALTCLLEHWKPRKKILPGRWDALWGPELGGAAAILFPYKTRCYTFDFCTKDGKMTLPFLVRELEVVIKRDEELKAAFTGNIPSFNSDDSNSMPAYAMTFVAGQRLVPEALPYLLQNISLSRTGTATTGVKTDYQVLRHGCNNGKNEAADKVRRALNNDDGGGKMPAQPRGDTATDSSMAGNSNVLEGATATDSSMGNSMAGNSNVLEGDTATDSSMATMASDSNELDDATATGKQQQQRSKRVSFELDDATATGKQQQQQSKRVSFDRLLSQSSIASMDDASSSGMSDGAAENELRIEELQAQLAWAQRQVAEAKTATASMERERDNARLERDEVIEGEGLSERQREEATALLASTKTKLRIARKSLGALKRKHGDLKQRHNDSLARLTVAEQQSTWLAIELKAAEDDREMWNNDCFDKERNWREATEALKSAQKELADAEKHRDEFFDESCTLRSEVRLLTERLEQQLSTLDRLQLEARDARTALELQLTSLETALEQRQVEARDAQAIQAAVELQLATSDDAKAKLEAQLRSEIECERNEAKRAQAAVDLQRKASDDVKAKLEAQLLAANKQILRLEEQADKSAHDMEWRADALAASNKRNSWLDEEIKKLKDKLAEGNERITYLEERKITQEHIQRMGELRNERHQFIAQVEQLKGQLTAAIECISELEEQREASEAKLSDKSEQLAAVNEQNSKLQEEIDRLPLTANERSSDLEDELEEDLEAAKSGPGSSVRDLERAKRHAPRRQDSSTSSSGSQASEVQKEIEQLATAEKRKWGPGSSVLDVEYAQLTTEARGRKRPSSSGATDNGPHQKKAKGNPFTRLVWAWFGPGTAERDKES
ncbi:LOW QUALITY PROTEIN: hypothetical protein ACHAXT_006473 [Thalassiosira profunda]